jgi:tyrosyl-tRNA synthetase
MIVSDKDQQLELIYRGVDRVIEEREITAKVESSIRSQAPLVVKLGADPTAPDLHLGHTVVFRKLRHFQQLGHKPVFLIGDFTGRIGDPTGRDQTRPPLTAEQVQANAVTYQKQIGKILDLSRLTIVFNSSWLKSMLFEDVVRLTSWTTMARLLEHNTFRERFKQADSIRFNEMLYPFMQAYDSVELRADVELGGTDQTFNLTFGRDIQRVFGQTPQVCITLPILPGTDGKQKMSKSLGNYVGIDEPPYIMYEKLMRMVDENIVPYFTLLTDKPLGEIKDIEKRLAENPSTEFVLSLKSELAHTIVTQFHGELAANQSRAGYGVAGKEGIEDLEIDNSELAEGAISVVRLLMLSGRASSKGDARRLIEQGGVYVDNQKVMEVSKSISLSGPMLLRVGRTYLGRVRLKG